MTNFQELSDNAIKQAIKHELLESKAVSEDDLFMANYHLEQAKHFKAESRKYLKQVK